MITFVLIGILIFVIVENNKLTKENNELKNRINNLMNSNIQVNNLMNSNVQVNNLINNNIQTNINNNIPEQNKKEEIIKPIPNNQIEKKSKYTDKEIKNSFILIIGSILVILSAILFLTTTWNITNNILKSIVMLVMLIIFLACSYIADKVLKIPQTSKAFYYIALAYIPIFMISIYLFELFGNYLSINGDGNYVYLSICSIILTVLYYYNAKIKSSTVISIASIICSVLFVYYITSIITNQFSLHVLLLTLYSTILFVLYKKGLFYYNSKVHIICTFILFGFVLLSLSTELFIYLFINSIGIDDIITELLILFNVYFIFNKIYDKKEVFDGIFSILIIIIAFSIGLFRDVLIFKQSMIIMSYIIILLYNFIRNKSFNEASFFEVLFSSLIMCITSLTCTTNDCILPYVILLVMSFITILFYLLNPRSRTYSSFIACVMVNLTTISIIGHFNLSFFILMYINLLFIAISMLINNDYLKKALFIIGNIVFIFVSLIYVEVSLYLLLLVIIYTVLMFKNSIDCSSIFSRLMAYLYINVIYIVALRFIGISDFNYLSLCVVISTIIVFLFDSYKELLKDGFNKVYLIISFIVSLLVLNVVETSLFNMIILVLVNVLFLQFINRRSLNKNMIFITFASFIPYIYLKDLFVSDQTNYMQLVSYVMLLFMNFIVYKKNDNRFIIISYIYLLFHSCSYDESKYVILALFTIITYISYLVKDGKLKDIFNCLLYISLGVLFRFICHDLEITLCSIKCLPYLILIPILTRKFIKKYSNNYKIFEYISYILLNFFAFFHYISESDGMVFVCFLTIIVIVSYIRKVGPIFIISLISILINLLMLTRAFWLSLPWWLYVLIIGGILIAFAIYNEINSKKDKVKITEKLKKELDL